MGVGNIRVRSLALAWLLYVYPMAVLLLHWGLDGLFFAWMRGCGCLAGGLASQGL
jgi:hypothetical protein